MDGSPVFDFDVDVIAQRRPWRPAARSQLATSHFILHLEEVTGVTGLGVIPGFLSTRESFRKPRKSFTRASFSRLPSFVSEAITNRRFTSAARSFGMPLRSLSSIVVNGIFHA